MEKIVVFKDAADRDLWLSVLKDVMSQMPPGTTAVVANVEKAIASADSCVLAFQQRASLGS